MTLFKPRVGKVIFAQTTGGLSVIIPKQYYTYFHILFHLHTFLQMFLNNNFQFLNTYTKRALYLPLQERLLPHSKRFVLSNLSTLGLGVAIGWVGYDLSWVINELGI